MSLVVEDGTGKSNAESYAAIADVSAYAVKFGKTFATSPAAPAEAACRVATKWLDAFYRARLPGCVANTDQALEWPRSGVCYRGAELPSDEVPQQIIDAMCEAAIRELASPGALSPDIDRDAYIKSIQAGSVQIEYGGAVPLNTMFQTIDGILAPILGDAPSPFSMKAVRA
jgi:hypothetical protein